MLCAWQSCLKWHTLYSLRVQLATITRMTWKIILALSISITEMLQLRPARCLMER